MCGSTSSIPGEDRTLLAKWPLPCKANWGEHVNAAQTDAGLAALRRRVQRGSPFGDDDWSDEAVRRLGLESTLRPQGRPRRDGNGFW
jgi:putative transposase